MAHKEEEQMQSMAKATVVQANEATEADCNDNMYNSFEQPVDLES